MKIRITLTGTSPLLMHNSRLSDPLDTYAKELKVFTSKKRKTEEDHRTMSEIEFKGGLYIHKESNGPYVPGINVLRSLVEGGRINKLGKDVERGLRLTLDSNECPLVYKGPRDVAGLWADEESFVSRMSVKNPGNSSRVMRTRPIFKEWALEAEFEVDPGIITSLDVMQQIATNAGQLAGLGDYRPSSPHGGMYGRYDAEVAEL